MKYAACSGAVRWSGGLTVLSPGQSIADDHPLVVERPDLFTEAEPEPDIKMPAKPGRGESAEPPRVERATREPGEVRGRGQRTAPTGKRSPRKAAAKKETPPAPAPAAPAAPAAADEVEQEPGSGE